MRIAIELKDEYVKAFAIDCDSVNDSELVVDCLIDEEDFFEKYEAYKYEDGMLIFDEDKWNEIKNNVVISEEEKIKNMEETIEMLTECILEMSEFVYS